MTESHENDETRPETIESEAIASGVVDRRATEPVDGPPSTAGATFHATRDELLGRHPLLHSAEIARSYCAVADRVISVVAITPERIRRVDCWLGDVGFVTHVGANDPTQPLLGSVSDRARAVELTGSIVGSLVGGVPPTPADVAIELGPVGAIRPDGIPAGVDWLVVVSAKQTTSDTRPERFIVVQARGGTASASVLALDDPVVAEPAAPDDLDRRFARLIGPPPRSVTELLADD